MIYRYRILCFIVFYEDASVIVEIRNWFLMIVVWFISGIGVLYLRCEKPLHFGCVLKLQLCALRICILKVVFSCV